MPTERNFSSTISFNHQSTSNPFSNMDGKFAIYYHSYFLDSQMIKILHEVYQPLCVSFEIGQQNNNWCIHPKCRCKAKNVGITDYFFNIRTDHMGENIQNLIART
jgi:hypothetical protein